LDWGSPNFQVKSGAAYEAGKLIAFGRVADQASRFVDGQQAGVFVEDGEQVFQTRGNFNRGWTRRKAAWRPCRYTRMDTDF
jgi:hypothetical protein